MADTRPHGASDIERFYYKKAACLSKRSSLSLDSVLVSLLELKFGNKKRMRKWIAAQARSAQLDGLDAKSISRAVQENAIRIIADPSLVEALPSEEKSKAETQIYLAQVLGMGNSAKSPRSRSV